MNPILLDQSHGSVRCRWSVGGAWQDDNSGYVHSKDVCCWWRAVVWIVFGINRRPVGRSFQKPTKDLLHSTSSLQQTSPQRISLPQNKLWHWRVPLMISISLSIALIGRRAVQLRALACWSVLVLQAPPILDHVRNDQTPPVYSPVLFLLTVTWACHLSPELWLTGLLSVPFGCCR